MSTSDWLSTIALLIALASLLWNIINHVNDRKGNLIIDANPENDPSFLARNNSFTPAGRPIYSKAYKRIQIHISNAGREPRVIKRCAVEAPGKDPYIFGNLKGKLLASGEILTEIFHPIERIGKVQQFKIVVEDSLGKEYRSRDLRWEEVE